MTEFEAGILKKYTQGQTPLNKRTQAQGLYPKNESDHQGKDNENQKTGIWHNKEVKRIPIDRVSRTVAVTECHQNSMLIRLIGNTPAIQKQALVMTDNEHKKGVQCLSCQYWGVPKHRGHHLLCCFSILIL